MMITISTTYSCKRPVYVRNLLLDHATLSLFKETILFLYVNHYLRLTQGQTNERDARPDFNLVKRGNILANEKIS